MELQVVVVQKPSLKKFPPVVNLPRVVQAQPYTYENELLPPALHSPMLQRRAMRRYVQPPLPGQKFCGCAAQETQSSLAAEATQMPLLPGGVIAVHAGGDRLSRYVQYWATVYEALQAAQLAVWATEVHARKSSILRAAAWVFSRAVNTFWRHYAAKADTPSGLEYVDVNKCMKHPQK
ncbi:hypothetical protein DVH05_000192 [Phytophthora capsici]|nr:hypothetical protein DVH05_000192 [Phytophthora capsici]